MPASAGQTYTILLGKARLHGTISENAAFDRRRPVLLVHGGYHGAWCWDKWVQRMADDGRKVHAIDLRGHGGLEPDDDFLTAGFAEMVEDVLLAVREVGERPVLVGHSLGGLVAMLAALRAEVSGLLLLCPSPPGNLPGAARVPLVAEDRLVPALELSTMRARYAPHLDDAEAAAVAGALCAESPRLLNERYDLRVPLDAEALREKDLPILVVEGGRDDPERHPPGQDRAIAAFLGAEHLRLDDAPHDLMLGPGWRGWYRAIWRAFDDLV